MIIWQRHSVSQYSFMPFIAMLANGASSVLYGVTTGARPIALAGLFGTLCASAYVYVYIRGSPVRGQLVRQVVLLMLLELLLGFLHWVGMPGAKTAVTTLFTVCGCWLLTSPLAKLVRAWVPATVHRGGLCLFLLLRC